MNFLIVYQQKRKNLVWWQTVSEHTKSTLLPCVCTQGTLLSYVWVRNQIDNSSSGGRRSLAPHTAGSCPNKEGSLLDDVRTYYNYEGVAVCVVCTLAFSSFWTAAESTIRVVFRSVSAKIPKPPYPNTLVFVYL